MGLSYKGRWNVVANLPELADGIGTMGDTYEISFPTASYPQGFPRDLGSGSITYRDGLSVVYTALGLWVQTAVQYTVDLATAFGASSGGGTVTSVALTAPSAFTVTGSPIIASGTLALAGAGTTSDYVDGTGALQVFPLTSAIIFMFANVASSIPTYYQSVILTSYVAGTLGTTTTSISTTPTLLGVFATNLGYPGVTVLAVGNVLCHFETKKAAGANNYYTYFELYKRNLAGTETLLSVSDNTSSSALNTTVQQTTTASLSTVTPLLATDRLVVKIYGVMISSTASVDLYFDSTTSARLTLPYTFDPVSSTVSVIGTPNRTTAITTSGTTVVDIAPTYVGQTSITTLGDVTVGTMDAGVILGRVTPVLGSDATGDIYYRHSTGILARIPIGASTTVLHGGTVPGYSQIVNGDIANSTIDLTTKVTGALPVPNGGTGAVVLTPHSLLVGNSTSAVNSLAPGIAGNFPVSNGTDFVATANPIVNNAVTAASNAATVPVIYRLTTVTNNAAGAVAITLTTSGATDGQLVIVRFYDFSAVSQTLSWVNTENSTVSVPTASLGSTTLPSTVGFMFNFQTTKWRCIASA